MPFVRVADAGDGRMSTEAERAPETPAALLRAFAETLARPQWKRMAGHAALTLGTAFAGSAATLCLVPLVQPGQALRFGSHALRFPAGIAMQAATFVAASAAFAVLRWLTARLAADVTSRYAVALRRRVHASLIEAPLASLAGAGSAEVANVLTYNIEIITQGFSALLQLLAAGVTALVSLALAFLASPALMLAAPLLLALGLSSSRRRGREQSRVSRRYVADMTRLFWLSEDFPRRLRHVRSFGREDAEKASHGDLSARLGDGYRRQLELIASGRLALELAAAAGIAGVLVLARLWHGGDRASFIAASLLLGRLLPYLVSTRQNFQQLRSAAPALELWRRHARLQPARPATRSSPMASQRGVLHIERLRWAPPAAGLEVHDLRLVPGELILVRGDSGIGKSSLMDVLAGMTEPRLFRARLDGRPIDFDGYRSLASHGAYVGQGVRPWQLTVRECLCWAAPDADEATMWQALADTGLAPRLGAGSRGLDTPLDDASNRFSGGELQRLLLAQVMLRQPCLALLDEATHALDALSEHRILAAMKRRLPGTILVVVSHRTGLSPLADRCLTIAHGRARCREPSRDRQAVT